MNAYNTAFGCDSFCSFVRNAAGVIDYFVKATMTINHRMAAGSHRLKDGVVGCVSYIDHHA